MRKGVGKERNSEKGRKELAGRKKSLSLQKIISIRVLVDCNSYCSDLSLFYKETKNDLRPFFVLQTDKE